MAIARNPRAISLKDVTTPQLVNLLGVIFCVFHIYTTVKYIHAHKTKFHFFFFWIEMQVAKLRQSGKKYLLAFAAIFGKEQSNNSVLCEQTAMVNQMFPYRTVCCRQRGG